VTRRSLICGELSCICKQYTNAKRDLLDLLSSCEGFEWDLGNVDKVWRRHHVSTTECEELFLNLPLIVEADKAHSISEDRLYVLDRSDVGRFLFIAFAIRKRLIRIISARDMSRRERVIYKSAI
jgi:uncharacterized protein